MNTDEARELLRRAELFYCNDEKCDEKCVLRDECSADNYVARQQLNLNDVWAWACSDGETVSDEDLLEVARLFVAYGWCGVLYWVSKRNGNCRSEFLDNNRFIDFARHEEELKAEVPNSEDRAYHKIIYKLGGDYEKD